jgi:1,4-dihydroxy-2-naphthoyl-CoA synthase
MEKSKRAREIWFLLEQYSAEQAERWGLVNKVVPAEKRKPDFTTHQVIH